MRLARLSLLVCSLLAAPSVRAETEASLDHSGSVGLLVSAGTEFSTIEIADCPACKSERTQVGFSASLEVGGSVAVGSEGNELTLRLRFLRLTPEPGEMLLLGFRNYFGRDALKTYTAFDLVGSLRPMHGAGGRAAFGLMYDFSPLIGLWSEAGASFALGGGRRFGADISIGVQGRSYLLE
jgi:hypothetical protein